ncbi:hypothetical protein PGTUg99_008976 [Puccinia graminis f. sp. tritici]|uniref:Uncharacterized protein n=1 Tax=Puccinia graminis f. sp. tritici TaxID=56615 RepID=A0A5B0SCR5_PUCGR|nr:hypothetical protein PGTUg99_008976 [Puccinia graminis f. sp. tritici]
MQPLKLQAPPAVISWRTDRPGSPISFTQQWKVLLGERNRVDNVGGKEATHRQSNSPANRAPTQPFSQPGRMGWTTVHKRSYNMAVQPLWSTPSSNPRVILRLEDRCTSRMVPEPPTHKKCDPVVYFRFVRHSSARGIDICRAHSMHASSGSSPTDRVVQLLLL